MSALLPVYREPAQDRKPRPRIRIVAVPTDDKWGFADVQRVVDVLEHDERIVSVYPVAVSDQGVGGFKHRLEALVEVVALPPSPVHSEPLSPQAD